MKKSLSLILAIIIVFSVVLTSCKDENPGESKKEAGSSETTGDASSGYKLVKGASSKWELYKTVLKYLNNGFHYDDIKDVFDPVLCAVMGSKMEEKPERIFTLGMNYDEACDLIVRLKNVAKGMDFLTDEDGRVDMDYVDFAPFIREFPEEMQPNLSEDNGRFVDFIEGIIYLDELFEKRFDDGSSPFFGDQTHWDELSRADFEKLEEDQINYHDFDKDLFINFPRINEVSLGEYPEGGEYIAGRDLIYTGYYYVEIDGRYYIVSFHDVIGTVG